MMVRVQYQNCRYDYVDTRTLNKLLKRKELYSSFVHQRNDGFALSVIL